MQKDWIEYQCKSGQTLFAFNKVTGEYKWPLGLPEGIEYRIICSRPVEHKQVSTTATQTDDNGCNNGCMSKSINTNPSHISDTSNGALPHQQTGFSNEENPLAFELQMALSKLRHKEDKTQSSQMFTASQDKDYNNDDYDDHNENTSADADDKVQNQNPHTIGTVLRDVTEMKSSTGFGLFADTTFGHESCDGKDDGGTHCSDSITHGNVCDDNFCVSDDHHGDTDGHYSGYIRSGADDADAGYDAETCDDDNTSRNMLRIVYKQDDEIEVLALEEKEFAPVVVSSAEDEHLTQDVINPPGKPDLIDEKTQDEEKSRESHECSVCGKVFKWKVSFQKHFDLQTVECKLCQKKFSSKCSLITHLVTHNGEKRFKCSYCKKTCSSRSTLTKHIRVHTKEKPFECSACDKKFSRKENLKTHVTITHTGKKPFECTVCGKKFSKKHHLKEHSNIHTGEKPFECNICKKKFIHRRSYHRHIITCKKPFTCSICNKAFMQKSLLESHLKTHS